MGTLKDILLISLLMFTWMGMGVTISFPIRIPVKLIHEAWKAFVIFITGGKIRRVELHRNFGGILVYEGGSRPLMRHSSFPFSMVFGLGIMLASFTPAYDDVLMALGLITVMCSVLLVSDWVTLMISLIVGVFLCLFGYFVSGPWEMLLVRYYGLSFIAYSLIQALHLKRIMKHIRSLATDSRKFRKVVEDHPVPLLIFWSVSSFIVLLLCISREIAKGGG